MKCPVCQNSSTGPSLIGRDILFEASPKEFALHRCGSCGCLFLHPMPSPAEVATFYPADYWWSPRGTPIGAAEALYRRIVLLDHQRFVTRAAGGMTRPAEQVQILDVGCGSGALLGMLGAKGFQVTGLDFSPEASAIALREHGVRVVVGSLAEARFADRSFDVVTLFHVMEHVPDPAPVLAEVARILKPGGRLIVQVPNIDSLQFRWFGARWYGLDVPRHLIDYSLRSIVGAIERCGFRPIRIRHFSLRDNAPALVSSMFPALDPVSRAVRERRRGRGESVAGSWARHLAYLLLVVLAYPVAMAEAALGRGATLMIEAAPKETGL